LTGSKKHYVFKIQTLDC